jgi:hypothetical protein
MIIREGPSHHVGRDVKSLRKVVRRCCSRRRGADDRRRKEQGGSETVAEAFFVFGDRHSAPRRASGLDVIKQGVRDLVKDAKTEPPPNAGLEFRPDCFPASERARIDQDPEPAAVVRQQHGLGTALIGPKVIRLADDAPGETNYPLYAFIAKRAVVTNACVPTERGCDLLGNRVEAAAPPRLGDNGTRAELLDGHGGCF